MTTQPAHLSPIVLAQTFSILSEKRRVMASSSMLSTEGSVTSKTASLQKKTKFLAGSSPRDQRAENRRSLVESMTKTNYYDGNQESEVSNIGESTNLGDGTFSHGNIVLTAHQRQMLNSMSAKEEAKFLMKLEDSQEFGAVPLAGGADALAKPVFIPAANNGDLDNTGSASNTNNFVSKPIQTDASLFRMVVSKVKPPSSVGGSSLGDSVKAKVITSESMSRALRHSEAFTQIKSLSPQGSNMIAPTKKGLYSNKQRGENADAINDAANWLDGVEIVLETPPDVALIRYTQSGVRAVSAAGLLKFAEGLVDSSRNLMRGKSNDSSENVTLEAELIQTFFFQRPVKVVQSGNQIGNISWLNNVISSSGLTSGNNPNANNSSNSKDKKLSPRKLLKSAGGSVKSIANSASDHVSTLHDDVDSTQGLLSFNQPASVVQKSFKWSDDDTFTYHFRHGYTGNIHLDLQEINDGAIFDGMLEVMRAPGQSASPTRLARGFSLRALDNLRYFQRPTQSTQESDLLAVEKIPKRINKHLLRVSGCFIMEADFMFARDSNGLHWLIHIDNVKVTENAFLQNNNSNFSNSSSKALLPSQKLPSSSIENRQNRSSKELDGGATSQSENNTGSNNNNNKPAVIRFSSPQQLLQTLPIEPPRPSDFRKMFATIETYYTNATRAVGVTPEFLLNTQNGLMTNNTNNISASSNALSKQIQNNKRLASTSSLNSFGSPTSTPGLTNEGALHAPIFIGSSMDELENHFQKCQNQRIECDKEQAKSSLPPSLHKISPSRLVRTMYENQLHQSRERLNNLRHAENASNSAYQSSSPHSGAPKTSNLVLSPRGMSDLTLRRQNIHAAEGLPYANPSATTSTGKKSLMQSGSRQMLLGSQSISNNNLGFSGSFSRKASSHHTQHRIKNSAAVGGSMQVLTGGFAVDLDDALQKKGNRLGLPDLPPLNHDSLEQLE